MGIKKRVSALLLAIMLSFGLCAVDYLKVDALEVGGSVVWDTAINYLLGLLGLSPIAENGDKIVDFDAMRSKWVQDYEAYFYANVQPEDLPEGYTKERAYQNWIDNVCRGNLNTVEYGAWDIFKEWAETLTSESSGGSGTLNTFSTRDMILTVSNLLGFNVNFGSDFVDKEAVGFYCDAITNNRFYIQFFLKEYNSGDVIFNISSSPSTASQRVFVQNASHYNIRYDGYEISNGGTIGNFRFSNYTWNDSYTRIFDKGANNLAVILGCFSAVGSSALVHTYLLDGSSPGVTEKDYASVVSNVTDLQIINDYSTTTTQNVVSIDWDRIGAMISDAVGTVTGSLDRTITDALDDAQEKVAAGTMSVSNYNDYVTQISNTYVYDITNETSITNPDSTVTGVVSGNVSKAEFTLDGLQYVFPFCIPWDIRDFVTLLVADPVAPVIEYPIYNPVTDTDEIITIDFSLWEDQVRIIRYIFDFLLIIGLLLLARSLIGAGGGD